jgi:hypothetical protein
MPSSTQASQRYSLEPLTELLKSKKEQSKAVLYQLQNHRIVTNFASPKNKHLARGFDATLFRNALPSN